MVGDDPVGDASLWHVGKDAVGGASVPLKLGERTVRRDVQVADS
jgi:hypothetical protein